MASDQSAWLTAFVLHTRPYTDSRMLIELFTREQGRVASVVRVPKKQSRSDLQVCRAVSVQLGGRGSLKTIRHIEAQGSALPLTGRALFSALYLNELIQRLLPEQDAHPQIFDVYQASLQSLSDEDSIANALEPLLRHFELSLLSELGFGMDFTCSVNSERPIDPTLTYLVDPSQGFIEFDNTNVNEHQVLTVSGETLVALQRGDFNLNKTRIEAKKLCRVLLAPHLGTKPLKSRELFL